LADIYNVKVFLDVQKEEMRRKMGERRRHRKVTKTFFSLLCPVSRFNSVRASVSELLQKKGWQKRKKQNWTDLSETHREFALLEFHKSNFDSFPP
jgi:hypothetical protein